MLTNAGRADARRLVAARHKSRSRGVFARQHLPSTTAGQGPTGRNFELFPQERQRLEFVSGEAPATKHRLRGGAMRSSSWIRRASVLIGPPSALPSSVHACPRVVDPPSGPLGAETARHQKRPMYTMIIRRLAHGTTTPKETSKPIKRSYWLIFRTGRWARGPSRQVVSRKRSPRRGSADRRTILGRRRL